MSNPTPFMRLPSLTKGYFRFFKILKNYHIALNPGSMVGVSKSVDTAFFVSVLQALNLKFLLQYLFFADRRGCQGCNAFHRQGILIVAGCFILFGNMWIFRNQGEGKSAITPHRAEKLGIVLYIILSIALYFV